MSTHVRRLDPVLGRPSGPRSGEVEGVPDDPFGALPSDDPRVDRDLGLAATGEPAARRGVEAFGVLPDDRHVDVLRRPHLPVLAADPVSDPGIESARSDVGEQVELLPEPQDESTTGEVSVREERPGPAYRTHEEGVGPVGSGLRLRLPFLASEQVVLAAPGVLDRVPGCRSSLG